MPQVDPVSTASATDIAGDAASAAEEQQKKSRQAQAQLLATPGGILGAQAQTVQSKNNIFGN